MGSEAWSSHLGILAKNVLVKLVIAKGGGLTDITVRLQKIVRGWIVVS
ncbi:hypothetical protein OV450_7270 [Actinobacteria bacterium OV450]|nr:hypothetical protein OV450_7270 [Actinobacteria bacterium OV450]